MCVRAHSVCIYAVLAPTFIVVCECVYVCVVVG